MAANINGVLRKDLQNAIYDSRVLVVGAGGIGCEILKNLVMSGFKYIEIMDLDQIDVSNLNRQFLFQKQHVGKSKALVARETALTFNPDVSIKAHLDDISSPEYGLPYFNSFSLVLNALDNRTARNHVNRMCLAANTPLIESGTAGYDGQVEVIKKGTSQCYECMPKPPQKTFPGCTIRNTPSEPIHCIVWSKHLFNQLFGEEDPDQDVSPDTADPEASGDKAGEGALNSESNDKGNVDRVSTRLWAQSCGYNPEKLFTKLFHDDIKYLLSMDNLWKKRRPPTPLDWKSLPDVVAGCSKDTDATGLKEQQKWSIAKCAEIFANALQNLKIRLEDRRERKLGDYLIWDKDNKDAMDFVAACANIRAYIFGIPQKSRYDIKSMAGNIIPAIATTNAIIAGVVVLHAFRVLTENFEDCKSVYLRPRPNHKNELLVPEKVINPPNPKCYVCAPTPTAIVAVDTNKMTISQLNELVFKGRFNMLEPDVILDCRGVVLLSSEEGETDEIDDRILADIGVRDGTILKVDDFRQSYSLTVHIVHREKPSADDKPDEPDFLVVADENDLKPKEEKDEDNDEAKPSTSNGQVNDVIDDDDCVEIDVEPVSVVDEVAAKKRKTDDVSKDVPTPKKRKTEERNAVADDDDDDDDEDEEDDDCCIVDSVEAVVKKSPQKRRVRQSTDDECQIVFDDGDDASPAKKANSAN